MERTPIQMRNDKLGEQVVKALKARHFEAVYCSTCAEALQAALDYIPNGDTVAFGGSMTIRDMGLTQRLHEGPYQVLDRDLANSPEESAQMMREAFSCGTYVSSANAISEDGQLVNIDGNGNRVAAMIYGPRNVVVVAGLNKVAKTLEDAMTRAQTVAAPINCQRFEKLDTPCNRTGACLNCKSPDCICAYVAITRVCRPAGKIKVILVGETLGY